MLIFFSGITIFHIFKRLLNHCSIGRRQFSPRHS